MVPIFDKDIQIGLNYEPDESCDYSPDAQPIKRSYLDL